MTNDRREVLTDYWHLVWEHLAPSSTKYHDAEVDVANDTVRVWFADPALREAGIEWRSTALGTREGGPGAGLAVGVPAPEADLRRPIDAIAAATIPHVEVVVVQDDSRPDSLLFQPSTLPDP